MKKNYLWIICCAGILFSACTITATTTVDEKNKSTDTEEVENKNEEEEVVLNSISDLYSTRCYNSIVLKWTNPVNPKLEKIKITYNNNTLELEAACGEEMEIKIDGLENGELIDFIIEAYNSRDEMIDVQYISNYAGHSYNDVLYISDYAPGDQIGTKLSYVSYAGESGISRSEYQIPEVVVIPDGMAVIVEMDDDCCYDAFIAEDYVNNIGKNFRSSFEKSKSIVMKPFSMCVYEMDKTETRILNPKNWPMSISRQSPVTNITYLDAIKICNDYTIATMSESDCVYYADEECSIVYSDTSNPFFYINEYCRGYRLPTKTEWEFAARGGNPNSENWKNSYSGSTSSVKYDGTNDNSFVNEKELYKLLNNCDSNGNKIKKSNDLGLYEMTAGVWEFTLDYYYSYEVGCDNEVVSEPYYIVRACGGFDKYDYAYECFNSYSKDVSGKISSTVPFDKQLLVAEKSADEFTGFRMVRNLN